MSVDQRKSATPVTRVQNGDMIMTFEEVKDMLRIETDDMLYKLNAQLAFPVYKRGKHCLYIYSQVLNWFLNRDVAIKDKSSLQRNLSIDDLPKLWPMFRPDGTRSTPAERAAERAEAKRVAARAARAAAAEQAEG